MDAEREELQRLLAETHPHRTIEGARCRIDCMGAILWASLMRVLDSEVRPM